MFTFGEREIAKEKFLCCKKPIKIWDTNVDNIVISKLIETKTNSKILIGYLDKDIRPLVLKKPKMSGYIKTFKVKEEDKDKNNKLITFRIDDEKLLEKYKSIWTKIEYLKNIELKLCGLNFPEDDIECESFTVISIDSLIVYENKYYL